MYVELFQVIDLVFMSVFFWGGTLHSLYELGILISWDPMTIPTVPRPVDSEHSAIFQCMWLALGVYNIYMCVCFDM